MKGTMRPGAAKSGPGPHRAGRWHLSPAPHFVDTDDEGGIAPPLIDPLDDRDGRC